MKKLIGTVAVAALLATAAFAEVSISGWGRGLWAPIGYDGDLKMTHGTSWSNSAPRIGVSVGGNSENFGFAFGFSADGGTPEIQDVANVWVKPWDFLKVSIGMIQDDTLRVNAGFGQYTWLRQGAGYYGEDLTFRRIGGYDGYTGGGSMKGAEIALTPIDGLYIAAGFKLDETTDFVDVLKVSQYAVGYKIEDLLAIKAQYIGMPSWPKTGEKKYVLDEKDGVKQDDVYAFSCDGSDYYGIINAAVDLLMIENNFISIGAYIPTDFDKNIVVSAVYNGGFDALSLNALVGALINDDFGLHIGVGVGYDLGNGLAIEADVRTELTFPKNGDAKGNVTVGAFFTKGFSNGVCGIGAEVGIPFGKGTVDLMTFDGYSGGNDKVHFAIPVKAEYFF